MRLYSVSHPRRSSPPFRTSVGPPGPMLFPEPGFVPETGSKRDSGRMGGRWDALVFDECSDLSDDLYPMESMCGKFRMRNFGATAGELPRNRRMKLFAK